MYAQASGPSHWSPEHKGKEIQHQYGILCQAGCEQHPAFSDSLSHLQTNQHMKKSRAHMQKGGTLACFPTKPRTPFPLFTFHKDMYG